MNKSTEHYKESRLEMLAEKEFIEWMIENLSSDQMLFILDGIGMEIRRIKGKKLPKLFLKNKLLIKPTRIKLRDSEIFPPFEWIMKIEGDLTEENLISFSDDEQIPKKEKALSLFLQNHYERAFELYEKRNGEGPEISFSTKEILSDKKAETPKELNPENKEVKKLEKKLTQKLANLEVEKEKLSNNLRLLQKEMKEKLALKQSEINRLNGLLLNEKKMKEEVVDKEMKEKLTLKQNEINRLNGLLITEKKAKEEAITDEVKERERIIDEVNLLKEENDKFNLSSNGGLTTQKQEKEIKKEKIALLGDPKNKKIMANTLYDVVVFNHESFQELFDSVEEFTSIYLLKWRFSYEEFEKKAPIEILRIIKPIETFMELRKTLEGPANVN